MQKALWLAAIVAGTLAESRCNDCSFGVFGASALANAEGCNTFAAAALVAGFQHCSPEEREKLPSSVVQAYQSCKGLTEDLGTIPLCLLHAGPKTYVTVISAALLYAGVLAIAMLLRPATAKCA